MTVSSAPGPKIGHKFAGYNADAIMGFIPSVGDMKFGFTIFSLADTIKLGMITDKYSVKHPDELMRIVN
jgi:hypothetical protein